ncbi:MAG: DNA-binding domain-containing protein [Planctomycetota bacterium]
MPEPSLAALQRWMSLVVRHPEDPNAASHTEAARALIERGQVLNGDVVRPSPQQQPLQRLGVYHGGYLARLIEVLEHDYSALRYALGDDAWRALATDYVLRHPSQHPNLNGFGHRLPAFVASQDLPDGAFLAELARLQWAVTEAFDAPEFEPLDVQSLATLSEGQWADLVLHTNPSLRLLAFDYPTNGFLQAFFDGEQPKPPKPHTIFVSVYRKEGRVWRTKLPEPAFRILAALHSGEPFGKALDAGGEHEEDITTWFQEWSADGVFRAQ